MNSPFKSSNLETKIRKMGKSLGRERNFVEVCFESGTEYC